MGVISPSSITGKTSTVSTTGGVSSALGKVGLGGVGTTVSNALGSLDSGLSGAENYASNLLGSATSEISSGVDSIESGIGSVAGSIGDKVSSLFSSSTDNKSSDISTKGNDPLKTSTVKGTPQSKIFSTNSQYSQTQPIDLQSKQPAVSKTTAGLKDIATRLGSAVSSTESAIVGAASSITHNSLITGLYNDASSVVSTVQSTVSDITGTVQSVENTVGSTLNDFTKQYGSFFRGLADGSNISLGSLIDTGLPTTADANGNAIAGIPSNIASNKLDSLYGALKGIGCSVQDRNYTSYAAKQSFKGSLLEIASKLNMKDAFRQMTSCAQFQDANSVNKISKIFTNTASTNPGIANTAAQAVSDPSKTPIDQSLAKAIVSNANLTSSDVPDISSMFSQMSVDPNKAYAMPSNGTSDSTWVFDSDVLKQSPTAVSNALLGKDIVSAVNDIPLQ